MGDILGITSLAVLSIYLDVFFTSPGMMLQDIHTLKEISGNPLKHWRTWETWKSWKNHRESGLTTHTGHPSYIEPISVYSLIFELPPSCHTVSALQIDDHSSLAAEAFPIMRTCDDVFLVQLSPFWRVITASERHLDSPTAPHLKSIHCQFHLCWKEKRDLAANCIDKETFAR